MNPETTPAAGPTQDRSVEERAREIRMILMDVDGVLTDGRLLFSADPEEGKFFDVRDGVGIHLARKVGLLTGIITGRKSEAVRRRAEELFMDEIHQKALDKLPVYEKILKKRSLRDREICYVGDDWVDIPILRRVGLAVTPADADPDTSRFAHHQTRRPGGRGAIREVIEIILRAQGKWQPLLDRYTK